MNKKILNNQIKKIKPLLAKCIVVLIVVFSFTGCSNIKNIAKTFINKQKDEKETIIFKKDDVKNSEIENEAIIETNNNDETIINQQPIQSSGELVVLDEDISVYSSPMADRQWLRNIYKDEKVNFYETKNDGVHIWYRIGNNEWIKDINETRVKITKALSNNPNTSFTIEIIDEKMGVYSSYYDNRQWVKSVYAGERYTCYEIYSDSSHVWYRIGNNEWIKDSDGSRVKTIESSTNGKVISKEVSNLIELYCYETMLDGSSGYYYRIGDNDWIRSNDRNLLKKDSNTITINKQDYQVYHLNGYCFYTTIGNKLMIYGCDNDGIHKWLTWPDNFKNDIKEVHIGLDVVGIGSDSFVDWQMEKIVFSNETKYFEKSAFNNCSKLKCIEYKGYGDRIEQLDINDYLAKYGDVFYNCPIEEVIYS